MEDLVYQETDNTTKLENCLTVSNRSSSVTLGSDSFKSIWSLRSEADDVDIVPPFTSTTPSLILDSQSLFQIKCGKPCSKQIESEIPEVGVGGTKKLRRDDTSVSSTVEHIRSHIVSSGRIQEKTRTENTRDVENRIISYSREVWKEGGGCETGEDSLSQSASLQCSPNSLFGDKVLGHHFKRKRRPSRNSISSSETGVDIYTTTATGVTERKSIFKLFTRQSSDSSLRERSNILQLLFTFKPFTRHRKGIVHPWLRILSPLLSSSLKSLTGTDAKIKMDHEDLIAELPQIGNTIN